jgi:putative nucleotidyltransferase with HDIG domain
MSASADTSVTDAQILQAATEIGVVGAGHGLIPLVMARLCDPDSTAHDVAQVIGRDPGLAARVLRVANSAYYGAAGSVATLERAFVLLGVDAVRGIAAAACLDRATVRAIRSSPIGLESMLQHAVAVACAAESLARVSHRSLASEAFIAGLLHDFGVMLQLQVDRARLLEVIAALGADPRRNPREVERSYNCIGHEQCAAVVFRVWNLPEALVAAVSNHHAPAAAPPGARRLAALVHVADIISLGTGHGFALEPQAGPLQGGTLELLGITETLLSHVVEALPERVRELQRVLSEP